MDTKMKYEPLVSIIMSVYNCENTIREAIDSLLAQTYTKWETIICNDASTDGTQDVLDEYKKRYPDRFILLKNDENRRLSYSLNRCLSESHGEFIARMDGDDISHRERLEKQVSFLVEHDDYQVVGTSMQQFEGDTFYKVVSLPEDPVKKMLVTGVPFCHATILMRKYAYDAVGGYKVSKMTNRSQDYDMWFRFYACGFKGHNIQEPLYFVREDISAIKRRTISNRIAIMQIQFAGYKLLHFPLYCYLIPVVQVCKGFVPSKVIYIIKKLGIGRK